MGFDIRLPIGILFTVIGLLLSAYGLASNPAIYRRSLGINVNLYWGVVMLVFGLVMLVFVLSRRKSRAVEHAPRGPAHGDS